MSKDALRVSLTQVRAMLSMLGIDPRTDTLQSVHMQGSQVEVVRARLDENGNRSVTREGVLLTETTIIAITVAPDETQAAFDTRAAAAAEEASAVIR